MKKNQSSPKKSRPSTVDSPSRASRAYDDLPKETSELQHKVLELETDNEHVKNVLIALNEKLLVFNDFKQDVANHKQFLKESENRRETLQMDIRTISTKVITDS